MVWPHALAGHFQAQVIQVRERAQVRAIKGSIGHVEVFQMDGVGISIIERPRPLPGHDTPNPAHNTYTLKCEEPVYFLDVSPVRNSTTSPSSTFTPARNAHDTSSEPEQSFAASNLKAQTL